MDGAEFAALDTLQHCLPGDAEGRGGDLDGNPAGGGVVGDEIPDGFGEADAPGGAGGDLLAGDESVVEPPVEGDREAVMPSSAAAWCTLITSPPGSGLFPVCRAGIPWRLRMLATLTGVNDIPVAVRRCCWLRTLAIIESS